MVLIEVEVIVEELAVELDVMVEDIDVGDGIFSTVEVVDELDEEVSDSPVAVLDVLLGTTTEVEEVSAEAGVDTGSLAVVELDTGRIDAVDELDVGMALVFIVELLEARLDEGISGEVEVGFAASDVVGEDDV